MNPLILLPGASVLMIVTLELPREIKKVFFKIPIWASSSAIALIVGTVCRGVLGPMTGFTTELLLWPGLAAAKKAFEVQEKRRQKKGGKNGT